MATIQGVYVALFGRPADPFGLEYWKGVTNDGADLSLIGDLAQSQEYQDRFAGQSYAQVVNAIYQSLFNRGADVAGLTYWVNGLTSGEFTVNDVAIRILDGAQGSDKDLVDNKIDAADKFTAALDTADEIIAYNGNDAAATARAWLGTVGTDEVTDDAVAAAVQDVVDGYSAPVTGTFTLTSGDDYADNQGSYKNDGNITSDFKFTAGNEKVSALAGTLGNDDVLLDNSTTDNDVLDATLISGATVDPTIQNIENFNLTITKDGSGLEFTNVTGVKAVSVTGGADGTLANVDLTKGTTLAINNYSKELTVSADLSGTTKDANAEALAVTVSGSKATLLLEEVNGNNEVLETLNIVSAGAAANTLALDTDAHATLGKVNVSGAADLTLSVDQAVITGKELDATGNGGAFTLAINTSGSPTSAANFKGVDLYQLTGGGAASLNNVADASTIKFGNSYAAASAITVKGAAAAKDNSLNLVLQTTATKATDVTLNDLTVANVETINVTSEGAKDGNALTLTAGAASTITIDGASDLDFVLASSAKTDISVDASAATGEVNIDVSAYVGTAGGAVETATITGNDQDNVITLGAGTDGQFVVDAGAGDDTIIVVAKSTATVTTGEGSDTIELDVTAALDAVTNLVVTDFTAGADGDVLATAGVVGAINFDDNGILANGETFVFTTAGLDGIDGDTLDAAGITALGAGQSALFVALNNNTGYAEVYALVGDAAQDWTTNGEIVKIATFENITTLTGLADLTADNFAIA